MRRIVVVASFVCGLLLSVPAFAHCDSVNGPVVSDARAALESGRVDVVLKWVKPEDEAAVREAFARTVAVRKQNDASRALADQWFFETVVRLHRAMEQEPFTGLRAADWKPEPVIEIADEALDTGKLDTLQTALADDVSRNLRERFERVRQLREHRNESVAAGRAFVAAYLDYLRFVESFAKRATLE